MKMDVSQRFGFLVAEVGRLYAQQFDRRSRVELGLTQPQVKLLAVIARHEDEPLSQAALAQQVGVTPMAVTTLCDRMAAAGWIERRPHPEDRRINQLHLLPKARQALERALAIGDQLTRDVLQPLAAAERRQLVATLGAVRRQLLAISRDDPA